MFIWLLADIVIMILVGAMGYMSMKKGFLKSSYKGISSFIAIILVFSFHVPFQGYLEHSFVGDNVRARIQGSVQKSVEKEARKGEYEAESAIEGMDMPDFLKSWVGSAVKTQKEGYEGFKENLTEIITNALFPIIMQILSVILLYLLIKILIWLLFFVLKFIFEIPILGAVDKILGLIIGGVNALLIVYVASALIMIFTPAAVLADVENGINATFLFKFFYYDNLLTSLFFG